MVPWAYCDGTVSVLCWYHERIVMVPWGYCDGTVSVLWWYRKRIVLVPWAYCDGTGNVPWWYRVRTHSGDQAHKNTICSSLFCTIKFTGFCLESGINVLWLNPAKNSFSKSNSLLACLTNANHILAQHNVRKFGGAVDGEDFNFGGQHKIDFTWLNRTPEGKAYKNASTTLTPLELHWVFHNKTR